MHQHRESSAPATPRFVLSAAVTLLFVIVEAVAGVRAHSLALLTDAGHNITDVVALALSGYALRLASRPASAQKTFGHHRAGILVALINSTTLALISVGIFYEAYRRLLNPPEVAASVLTGVATLALLVNAGTAWLVRKDAGHDLNVRSAYLHLMGDVLSSVGAIVAGVLIMLTGKSWIDPLASILIGLLILANAWSILRETVGILLEEAPPDIAMDDLVRDIRQVPGVLDVHDLHVWSITRGLRALSAHIVTGDVPISQGATIQRDIGAMLATRYRVRHATLQLECIDCPPGTLYCRMEHLEPPLPAHADGALQVRRRERLD